MTGRPGVAPTEVLDPVTVQVVRNAFVAAADEMAIVMINTAYNDLLYEVHDFGLVVTDADGNLLGQSDTLPVFLGVLPTCIRTGIERFGKDGFADGDVILANDPYTTGTHISDTTVYMPIFHDDGLVGFVGCTAHWADIGGKAPGGWCTDSTDVYQEGLRFDHIRLTDAGGDVKEDLLSVVWDNIRLPAIAAGDLGAQLAACRTGVRRVRDIYRKYGNRTVERAIEEMLAQAEKRMRAGLAEIPDGEYSAEAFLDHDGVDRAEQVRVRVTLTVSQGEVHADFTGTSPATRGPVNCPFPAVRAGVETALKALTLPNDRHNAGHLRPVTVTAPPDTVVNPTFPAPVDAYGYVYQLSAEAVLRALSEVLVDKSPAGSYVIFIVYFFRLARERFAEARSVSESAFVFVDAPVGGGGGWASGDGASSMMCLMNGDAPCPVAEMMESKYPLLLRQYALNPEGAGLGKHRGGMGVIKEYVMLEDDLYSQINIEQTRNPPWGLWGGRDAGSCSVIAAAGTTREELIADKVSFVGPFRAGDVLIAKSGGGGGWGDPFEREPDAVRQDVLSEFCTTEDARQNYGVVLDSKTFEIDIEATNSLRTSRHTPSE